MSYLSGIARLPASRKVAVALLAGLVVALNERLGWGLSGEAITGIVALGASVILGIAYEDAAKAAAEAAKPGSPTLPAVFTRSGEGGRANISGLVAFLVGCLLAVAAILASGCNGPAARHAADEAKRAAQYVAWMESGTVPVRPGVLEPASLTHALPMLRSQARAWEAQAYYLGSGPRPAWVREQE